MENKIKKDNTRKIAVIALILSILIITIFVFSHLHISIGNHDIDKNGYDCPGVGFESNRCTTFAGCYAGCSETQISKLKGGSSIILWWS